MKKSPNDRKEYRPLTLDNGLRVLLVHNSETQKSAAALAVNIGHFGDPNERQGLAHFLEHMLFLGTEKYPDGSEYQKFISQFGGSNNAWTATEHTCFFFDIHHNHFEPALDRFSQFFIAPLLSEEFVNKERKNIDAEFKLKLKDDIRRLYDVHKETINPEHPFSKFSVGNTETLADKPDSSLRNEVEAFFNQHYCASAMTLVLEGPHSLDELTSLAKDKFSLIRDRDNKNVLPNVPLYLPQHQSIGIQVSPVKNDRQLIISFALPSIDQYYRHKPESILAYLIGHEGKNSILSVLKQNQWALGLTAGSGINGYNFKDFNISVRLTDTGEAHIHEIIDIVFSYLALLKSDRLPEYYFEEKRAIADLSFHYHEKMKSLDSVSQLVINMHHYPAEDYIYGDYVMDHMDHEAITELLSYFEPDNMRYLFISQKITTDKVSKWYDVPYRIEEFSNSLIQRWKNITANKLVALPPPNDYIVANPTVHENQKQVSDVPEVILQKDGLQVWYKQDQTFKVPKGYIYIGIDTPATLISETHIAMTRLFVDLYTESVIEQHYDAELAGIHYNLYAHQGGLTLQLSGLSEKQNILLSQLLAELQKFSFSEAKFELLQRQLINHWRNTDNSKSISQLFSALSATMQPKNPSAEELTSALESVTYNDFNEFCKTIFKQINLEVLIHGNWRTDDANDIVNVIENAFLGQFGSDYKEDIPILDLASQGCIEYPLVLPEHDHAAVIYYPMADRNLDTVALTMVVSQILSPQFFHQMRTEKQYGYLVGVGFVPINRFPGLAFYIQSPEYDAPYLTNAMDEFINESYLLLDHMTDDDWQHLQHGLASQLQEKDGSLRIKSQRFWSSICNQEFDFKQKKRLIDQILKLTRENIKQFLYDHFNAETTPKDRFCLASLKTISDAELLKAREKLKKISVKY